MTLAGSESTSHPTVCPSCSAAFDAMTAAWCSCVAKRMSLVCSACGVCFCKAPDRVVREFWNGAPSELVHRRNSEQRLRRAAASRRASAADILIVDDDEDIRLAAAFMVQQLGYRTATASNAEEALFAIEQSAPRLVLTDALMPRIDGRQLCRYIKAADSGIKVVIMTSLYTSPRYRYEAYKQFGADEYLAKPIDAERLRGVLHKLAPVAAVAAGHRA
jgi:CheY-like chemotaxis protein